MAIEFDDDEAERQPTAVEFGELEGGPAGGDRYSSIETIGSAMRRSSAEAFGEPENEFARVEEGSGKSNSSALWGTVEWSRSAPANILKVVGRQRVPPSGGARGSGYQPTQVNTRS